jgi:hypothetical protein
VSVRESALLQPTERWRAYISEPAQILVGTNCSFESISDEFSVAVHGRNGFPHPGLVSIDFILANHKVFAVESGAEGFKYQIV